jgi:hypothetical protein
MIAEVAVIPASRGLPHARSCSRTVSWAVTVGAPMSVPAGVTGPPPEGG